MKTVISGISGEDKIGMLNCIFRLTEFRLLMSNILSRGFVFVFVFFIKRKSSQRKRTPKNKTNKQTKQTNKQTNKQKKKQQTDERKKEGRGGGGGGGVHSYFQHKEAHIVESVDNLLIPRVRHPR